MILATWAPTSSKWSCNTDIWAYRYKWATGVISPYLQELLHASYKCFLGPNLVGLRMVWIFELILHHPKNHGISSHWWGLGIPNLCKKNTSLGPSLLQGFLWFLRAVHFSSPKNGGLLTKSAPARLSWSVAHLRLNLHDLLGHSYVDIFDHIWCTVWHGVFPFLFWSLNMNESGIT